MKGMSERRKKLLCVYLGVILFLTGITWPSSWMADNLSSLPAIALMYLGIGLAWTRWRKLAANA
jgi:hypothetical protein